MAVIESVRQRQKNATDFNLCYENLCALQNSCPLGPVKANLDENIIDCNADRIRAADWLPILNSLKINKSLKCIAFRSYWQQTLYPDGEVSEQRLQALKKKAPAIRSKDLTHRLCRAIKECLYVTDSLKSVILQGIPLRERDLSCLAKSQWRHSSNDGIYVNSQFVEDVIGAFHGIIKNRTLEHLSLEFCQIGDHGVEVLCNAIKNSLSITSVNFTGCGLSWRGAESLAKVIKHQATRRHSVAWMDSLRYRRPDLDRMPGLRRITVCKNPLINDRGAELIAEALKDDLWLKALDMQQCGISTEGAQAFKSVLTYNTSIAVLDLRLNHLIDRDVMTSLMEQIMINTGESDSGFPWLVVSTPKPGRIRPSKKTGRLRVTSAVGGRRSTSASGSRPRTAPAKSAPRRAATKSSGGFVPWRTAARVGQNRHKLVKQRDETPVTKKRKPSALGRAKATSSPLPSEDDGHASGGEDSSSEGSQTREKLRELTFEFELLKQRLVEESRARASSDSRILELQVENRRLHQEVRLLRTKQQFPVPSFPVPTVRAARLAADEPQSAGEGRTKTVLEDDRVLESIEASFKQFHAFLDLLKGTGFGDLARLLGDSGRLQEHEHRLGPTTT